MDAAIQIANDRLAYVTSDEDARRAYIMRFKAMCDYTSGMNYATEKGMAKGMAKGIKKGHIDEKHEIARKLMAMGDSVEKIHVATGLPTETIESL